MVAIAVAAIGLALFLQGFEPASSGGEESGWWLSDCMLITSFRASSLRHLVERRQAHQLG
jgi:hypothetical protein